MNGLGESLAWGVVRGTVVAVVGAAVYLAARRRGPSAGASAALAGLLMMAGVTAISVAPWPRAWTWTARLPEGSRFEDPAAPAEIEAVVARTPVTDAVPESAPIPPTGGAFREAGPKLDSPRLRRLGGWLRKQWFAPRPEAPRWDWPAYLACAFGAGLGFELMRLAGGAWAVRRAVARSRPVDDEALMDVLATFQKDMKIRSRVLVVESASVASPATVGWLRPTIILPETWRAWGDAQRRVVLAHEVAHVGRGDYGAWLVARLALAVHFYHPLAHWLAARVRLEQELAADALAAQAAGGGRLYLQTLAGLALGLDSRPAAWAARPSLPFGGFLLRRIEMLRTMETNGVNPPSRTAWGTRAFACGAVFGAGLLLTALRVTVGPPRALAQDETKAEAEAPAATAAPTPFSLQFVPPDAAAVVALRPSALLERPELKPFLDPIRSDEKVRMVLDRAAACGVTPDGIEQILYVQGRTGLMFVGGVEALAFSGAAVVRLAQPLDVKKLAAALPELPMTESTYSGMTYHRVWVDGERGQPALRAAQRTELERRLDEHQTDPKAVIAWEHVKSEALTRVRR